MIDQATIDSIINYHNSGFSIRYNAKSHNVSRQTIRRYTRDLKPTYERPKGVLFTVDPGPLLEYYKRFKYNANNLHRAICEHPELFSLPVDCDVSLRTVQRFIQTNFTEERKAFGKPTVNAFHCSPGQQIQIDFTKCKFEFEDGEREVYIFEVVYSYSRFLRCYVCRDMGQLSWLSSICRFVLEYGVPREILCDNDKSLVKSNNGDHFILNPTFAFFCEQIGAVPKPCKPYRPQTKGRVERAGRYIKDNCLGYLQGMGVKIKDLEDLQKELDAWCINFADKRIRRDHRPKDFRGENANVTISELYNFERTFLKFPDIDPDKLQLQVGRFSVSSKGRVKFLGITVKIEEQQYWSSTVNVAVLSGGKYIITTEGGATICTGEIPSENFLKYPFKEKRTKQDKKIAYKKPPKSDVLESHDLEQSGADPVASNLNTQSELNALMGGLL